MTNYYAYRDRLKDISDRDVNDVLKKDIEYDGSWKRRGGVGAYMMTARKTDRLEAFVKQHKYDIFAAAAADTREEGILDDIGDLRRYLLLIEAEILQQQLESTAERCVPRNRLGEGQPRGFDPEQDLVADPDPSCTRWVKETKRHVYKAVEQATILADHQLKTLKEVAENRKKRTATTLPKDAIGWLPDSEQDGD